MNWLRLSDSLILTAGALVVSTFIMLQYPISFTIGVGGGILYSLFMRTFRRSLSDVYAGEIALWALAASISTFLRSSFISVFSVAFIISALFLTQYLYGGRAVDALITLILPYLSSTTLFWLMVNGRYIYKYFPSMFSPHTFGWIPPPNIFSVPFLISSGYYIGTYVLGLARGKLSYLIVILGFVYGLVMSNAVIYSGISLSPYTAVIAGVLPLVTAFIIMKVARV
ncbi:MAG: hypothetical protein DRO10_03920 [Thermoprotei archaeon]|nr:MAG: hypothetical protein DRO10_03920 [Thermoprotei archaeon]